MSNNFDILIFDIFVNQPELAKKVKRIINARGNKDDKKSKKK